MKINFTNSTLWFNPNYAVELRNEDWKRNIYWI